jgi:YHS domain-containing protein
MARVVDPVCGMTLESSARGQSEFNGTTFFFCTTACKREFDDKPATYYGKPIQPVTYPEVAGGTR